MLTDLNEDQALRITVQLVRELNDRQPDIEKAEKYYDGDHPLHFATPEFKQVFGEVFTDFADNWCQVVVDSVAERLEVTGFHAAGSRQNDDDTWGLWREAGCDVESNLTFIDAMIGARAFGLAWDGPDGLEITFEHGAEAIVAYVAGSRRKREFGLKRWEDEAAGLECATLYTSTQLWKFQRPLRSSNGGKSLWVPTGSDTGGWRRRVVSDEEWPLPNPSGEVPLVELQNRPRLRAEPASEIRNVMPLQDIVNLLWSHAITASDFAAYAQRVVMGAEKPTEAVYDADGQLRGRRVLSEAEISKRRTLWLNGPNVKIDEWSASDLDNYMKLIKPAVEHLAAQTRTPPHYLLGSMINTSGDALVIAETGLVAKSKERQRYFGDGLRELMRVAHLMNGNEKGAEAIAQGSVKWRDPRFRSETELVDALVKKRALEVPIEVIWEEAGYDQTEITSMLAQRDEQAQVDAAVLIGEQPPARPSRLPAPEPATA